MFICHSDSEIGFQVFRGFKLHFPFAQLAGWQFNSSA